MRKTAMDAVQGGSSTGPGTESEGPRERLVRGFERELPAQIVEAQQRWKRAVAGDSDALAALRAQLHRLGGEATMLQLPGLELLLAAVHETLLGVPARRCVPERVEVAVAVAIRACGELDAHSSARAEREAAQLRWLTQNSEAIASGVFPRRL